jgi:shikimate kinase
MTPDRPSLVFLTGFMGSGKSTIGPILANTLGYEAVDLDREIERKAGKRIAAIFADEGEEQFRRIERELLGACAARTRCIVSLGGGTVSSEENLAIIKAAGLLVYLKVSEEHILRRLRSKTDRPLLRGDDGGPLVEPDLRSRIRDILTKREPFYRRADLTIEIQDQRVGVTVDRLARVLRGRIAP